MNPIKATGMDGISPRFLKDVAYQLASNLRHVLSLSIFHSKVQDDLKHAQFTHFFSRKMEINYRPISVISCASMVLKKYVYDQMQDYVLIYILMSRVCYI